MNEHKTNFLVQLFARVATSNWRSNYTTSALLKGKRYPNSNVKLTKTQRKVLKNPKASDDFKQRVFMTRVRLSTQPSRL